MSGVGAAADAASAGVRGGWYGPGVGTSGAAAATGASGGALGAAAASATAGPGGVASESPPGGTRASKRSGSTSCGPSACGVGCCSAHSAAPTVQALRSSKSTPTPIAAGPRKPRRTARFTRLPSHSARWPPPRLQQPRQSCKQRTRRDGRSPPGCLGRAASRGLAPTAPRGRWPHPYVSTTWRASAGCSSRRANASRAWANGMRCEISSPRGSSPRSRRATAWRRA